ncbi:hypothetical protein ACQPZP_36965 [Spirillospora sp. CA-142024]|uniref:hypothetical protein n=1 Tax=Spirillospora sp. CA-142024 TaxID=3240036 RepID=UPI003D94B9CD
MWNRVGVWMDAIVAKGRGPLEWLERRRVRMPTADETTLLLIPAELPVWEIVRISYRAKDERAVDVTQVVIPGDRMKEVSRRRDDSAHWPHFGTGPEASGVDEWSWEIIGPRGGGTRCGAAVSG